MLRALGFTRLGLVRLILAEGLLIGLVAALWPALATGCQNARKAAMNRRTPKLGHLH